MVIHPLRKFMRRRLKRRGRGLLRTQARRQQNGGNRKAAAIRQFRHPHCRGCVQLVPPAGSTLIVPNWSVQKARSPLLPTACGTAVSVNPFT